MTEKARQIMLADEEEQHNDYVKMGEVPEPMDDDPELCPVCDEEFNHYIDNGRRNGWPTKGNEAIPTVKFEVCTPSDSDYMYVHTQDVKTPMCGDGLASLQQSREDDMSHYKYEIHVVYEEQAYGDGLHDATEADEHFDLLATSREEARDRVYDAAEWPIRDFVAVYELREARSEDFIQGFQ